VGNRSTDPCFLNFCTDWWWMVSFKLEPFYLWGKSCQYQFDRRLCGPQNRYGRNGGEKILDIPGLELRPLSVILPAASGDADCTIPASLLEADWNGYRFTVLYCQFYSGKIYGQETDSSYRGFQRDGMHLNGGNQSTPCNCDSEFEESNSEDSATLW
jgi:hypothetical protein